MANYDVSDYLQKLASIKKILSLLEIKLINSAETKLILKDLESESTYHVEANNENYQDIFSNTEIKKNSINTLEKNDKKTRQTFFNNYLNI